MATLPLSNNFNAGSSGSTISAANSGGASGDAFSAMFGSLMSYSNVQSHAGGIGAVIVDTAVTTAARWTTLGSLTTSVYVRAYVWLAAYPSTGLANIIQLDDSAAARCAQLAITTTGKIRTNNAAAATIVTGTASVPLSTWFRVELRVLPSLTVGEVEYRLFSSADSNTITETNNSTGQVLLASIDGIRLGLMATTPTAPFTIYFDDAAANNTGWPGPSSQVLAPAADVSAGGWTPSTGSTIYTMLDEAAASDTDYAISSTSPAVADETRIRMTGGTDPGVGTGHTISYRYLKDVVSGDQIDLTTTLYTANGNTVIQSWPHTNISTAGVTAAQVLGTAAADSIPSADYATGLILGFSAIKV